MGRLLVLNEIETVKEHCKHPDCHYRGKFGRDDYCDYIGYTGTSRNCPISQCDKYKPREANRCKTTWDGVIIQIKN